MRRWNPWNAVMAVVVGAVSYVVEWLVGVAPQDALVDATLTGFVSLLILQWWRG